MTNPTPTEVGEYRAKKAIERVLRACTSTDPADLADAVYRHAGIDIYQSWDASLKAERERRHAPHREERQRQLDEKLRQQRGGR